MGCIVLGVMACSTGPPPEGVVTGIVTAIDGDLTSVDEFTILTDDGEVVFATAPEIEFRFPVPHLRDHLRSGEQVSVEYRSESGKLLAMTVDDAPS